MLSKLEWYKVKKSHGFTTAKFHCVDMDLSYASEHTDHGYSTLCGMHPVELAGEPGSLTGSNCTDCRQLYDRIVSRENAFRDAIFPIISIDGKSSIYDDSFIIDTQRFVLNDGRPVTAQFWGEAGYSFLSYSFSSKELEDKAKEELLRYLIDQGVKIDPNIEPARYRVEKSEDCNAEPYWNFTITIGEGSE